ncbi:MAG TPA: protein translocase subunit SecD, partial [Myxococcales bacterium]|nr:protein translocase subunit SecD [Myxococcales bacterium]
MDRAWYWKAGLIAAVTLLAIWALVPSVTYFRLPAAERNEASAFEKARPKWAPAKHLNLGLDLQGGIHLVMGVEVDRAVREKAVRRAEELAAEMERKDVKGADVKGDPDTGIVTVTAPDVGKAKDVVGEYNDMYVRRTTGTSIELAMKDDAVKQLKESAVDQAMKAIRNRVDQWGVSEPTIAKRGDASILVQLPGYSNPEKAKELIGRTAQLLFKIVDDVDTSLTKLTDLPQGVTLNWDRYTGAGDALVSSPYLEAKDR